MTITTYTYLEDAIEDRLKPMLQEVGATFDEPITKCTPYVQERMTTPFWWIYVPPQVIDPVVFGANQFRVSYDVITRGVMGYVTGGGISGQLERRLYRILPTVLHYFQERPRLCYESGQDKPDHMQHTAVTNLTSFGVFNDGSNHIGIELQHTLTFTLTLTPAPGNA